MRLELADTTGEAALAYAKKLGFKFVNYAETWNGYDVYYPLFDEDGNELTGSALIFANEKEVRLATSAEIDAYRRS